MVRDAAESIIGPHFARTRWRLLTMRINRIAAPSVLILRSGEGRVSKDGCNGRCGHNLAFPRHDLPEFCIDIALAEERAPGARRTRRSLVCNKESTRVSRYGYAEILRHSLHNGLRLIRALPGDPLFDSHISKTDSPSMG